MPDLSDLIGVPFVNGGRDPAVGLDCWGLVMAVFQRFGITLPDHPLDAMDAAVIDAEIGRERSAWLRCRPPYPIPAVVVIRFGGGAYCNHVGVLVAPGWFMHAREKTGSCRESFDHPYYRRRIEGVYVPEWIT